MTKKDYELFANEINVFVNRMKLSGKLKKVDIDSTSNWINLIADVFQRDNSAFNRDKFERACYEGKHIRKSISGRIK